jgi:hypothetical protein
MLRYEASKDLNNAILNNWLLNIKGELGRHLPGDQHQEHYNKWLEAMAPKHGGDFDNINPAHDCLSRVRRNGN